MKKGKIEVRIGSKWYSFDKEMKKVVKKETVVKVTERTFTLCDESTKDERKVWRYYKAA